MGGDPYNGGKYHLVGWGQVCKPEAMGAAGYCYTMLQHCLVDQMVMESSRSSNECNTEASEIKIWISEWYMACIFEEISTGLWILKRSSAGKMSMLEWSGLKTWQGRSNLILKEQMVYSHSLAITVPTDIRSSTTNLHQSRICGTGTDGTYCI